ncbi:MAG: hypothetical protein KA795_04810 [Burkholderiaceae bacterium]|nr:hypothetical protein [Burkholderiaceae bacterium]
MSPPFPDSGYASAFVLARVLAIVFSVLAALSLPLLQAAGAPAQASAVVAWVLFGAAAISSLVMLATYWGLGRMQS